ncbi:NAD(P)/FAD-dependent oxidoreductase [Marinobacter sp. M3C]|uniref:NAD(P)/FAD-dependent oxidoreductase n=1 Tax=Marinobacter sp. M3C TaxID=2917715 RepID=UPI00200E0418|nr:NAD(P)/FAD-dependent oxidoreductase [Marinobacter sp. M3C]MCL1478848.1 NAD(P)/FAD-dependent oxidoreductase [Marinobacter sp.]MCL1484103.1 NAD(P)/FAD-dependent oxidoreductase [Marinobacter sp.]MCL1487441.1 NAD(P)/FAD-dependent oxidoreductase [Marinobacter sp.]UQG61142.1 NAD(P)/FAD-dependent oxidoreductase [Marinobacter sp. M3C]
MNTKDLESDIIIIGAGPSGAVAAALLRKHGYQVTILEKQHFPRFSIGESLLPQCMEFLEEAGMTEVIQDADFQHKNGAAFHYNGKNTSFNFCEKFSPGRGTTFQVQRAHFDHLLAQEAEKKGAEIRYGHEITAVDFSGERPWLRVCTDDGQEYEARGKYVLDASGFGRVLSRLLDLETPSEFPVRMSLFTHVEDKIDHPGHDRDKILITVHPKWRDVWFWLIPFANGRCSVGVVAKPEFIESRDGEPLDVLQEIVGEDPNLSALLANAEWDMPVRPIQGYSCNVKQLWGTNYALLGNAAEFLDPVFSSGVTIAMKSASLAAQALHRQFSGETVDWQADYAEPLMSGVDTFRTYVDAWYEGAFQDVVFAENPSDPVKRMISSILAGYAWDTKNPYVSESRRRLATLAELCRA